ncbi:hypothetical protein QUF74_05515 [Candidatus Halobeggiatoa sp. HSG11]|nr:hypothetical protein [Candidatus Halobeggiatoa sp. HSG11]
MKLSKFYKGINKVVCQQVLDGFWGGSVFVWRCPKKHYYCHVPTVLNVPFNNKQDSEMYATRCFNEGFRVTLRSAKRTSGKWEVQVFFPQGFTVKKAVNILEKFGLFV